MSAEYEMKKKIAILECLVIFGTSNERGTKKSSEVKHRKINA
jgi:hypothetical protein